MSPDRAGEMLRDPPVVSVVGEATVRVEPDEAILLVTLSALEDRPGPALEDVARRSGLLIALVDELMVAPSDRSTGGVTVQEEFDHTHNGRRSLGHRASATVSIRMTDPEQVGQLVTRVTTELSAQVDGPRWQIASENSARMEAARRAAADGRRKAQAYAEGVDAQLGELVGLVEPGAGQPSRRASGRWVALAAAGHDMPIEPGEQDVTATIQVTYGLIV